MLPPSDFDAADWLARLPPPYRLRCDLAVVPLLAPADAARAATAMRVPAAFGRAGLLLLLARYTSARYGPDQRRYERASEPRHQDLYREVSLTLPAGGTSLMKLAFATVWVDAQDTAPLALGHAYGFPKQPAAIMWEQTGRDLAVTVEAEGSRVLEVAAGIGWAFPGHLLTPLSGVWATFPAAGRRAPMRLEDTKRAALLRVRSLSMPFLRAFGGDVRTLPGFWLRDCVVALGLPQSTP